MQYRTNDGDIPSPNPAPKMLTKQAKQEAICKRIGHKLISDDYGNPNSGYMGAHCERCGFSFGNTLY